MTTMHAHSLLVWGLTLGLVQGFGHCAGMCGPFLAAFGAELAHRQGRGRSSSLPRKPSTWVHGKAALPTLFAAVGGWRDVFRPLTGVPGLLGRLPHQRLAVAPPPMLVPEPSVPPLRSFPLGDPPMAQNQSPSSAVPIPPLRPTVRFPLTEVALHHAGRITAFGVLGALSGAVGQLANIAWGARRLDSAAAVLGGALMLAWALEQVRTGRGGRAVERISLLGLPHVAAWFRRTALMPGPGTAFVSGLLLGFHPCGVLFAVLLSAGASGSAFLGGALLLAFGIGTLPALVAVSTLGVLGGHTLRGGSFRLLTALWVGLCGLLFVLRGLAFDRLVPSLNPWLF